jgi:hypothetical protein
MGTLATLLERLDPDSGVRGRQFELICRWYLTTDPLYRRELKRVWLWDEWPGRWGADAGSGFDPSKWAVTWGGSFVRSDYEAGHEWLDNAPRILLWLRPSTDEPIDPELRCQVNTAYGILVTSPTVGQVGGPLAPGTGRHNGVPNADYLIEYPSAFGENARMSDGMFEVMWLSGNVSIRGDSFVLSDGQAAP